MQKSNESYLDVWDIESQSLLLDARSLFGNFIPILLVPGFLDFGPAA